MAGLQQEFERHLKRSRFFNYQDKVVVAVSTGVDSMVLLKLVQELPISLRPQIIVAHMNHELRVQSIEEEQYLRRYCRQQKLQLVVKHWSRSDHPKLGIEEAARTARYRFLAEVMRQNNAQVLVTAHHQDDLIETILMKLTRGGQLPQLMGILDSRPFNQGRLVRPLLPFSKKQLKEYARQKTVKWYEDITNHELTIQRNRFRHEIIPILEKENSKFGEHLMNYRQQLGELLAWQQMELQKDFDQVVDSIGQLQLDQLVMYPQFLQKLLLERWLNFNKVYDLKQSVLDDLLQLIRNPHTPQQTVNLPGNQIFQKSYRLAMIKDCNKLSQKLQKIQPRVIELEQWYRITDTEQLAVATNADFFQNREKVMTLWLAPDQFPLQLRKWQAGDQLRLKNGGHQLVKKVLVDQKVTQLERQRQLVLVDAHGEVIWLLNRKWSWFSRPEKYRQSWRPLTIGIKDEEETKHE